MLTSIIRPIYAASVDLGGGLEGPGTFQKGLGDGATKTGDYLSAIVTTLTVVGGLAFVIFFILGGLKWITSGGDKGKTSEAADQMVHAAMGLIVIVAAYFIIGIIGGVLGLDILNPFATLKNATSPSN
jgi:hypothetical protein